MKTKVRSAFLGKELPLGIVPLVALLFLLAGSPLSAQTNAAKPALPTNRYLFIVETSRAMKSRSDGVLKAVEDLIGSGIGGQLRRGDTIALWTYNADLYAGHFPLQQWTPDTQKTLAVRILSFLKEQPYEKTAMLQKTLMTMDKVIKNSDFITVILISNGDQLMQGTPFDEQINNLYKVWDKEQQKAHMPFVTVLRATKGKITHFTLTSAPWPVDMPPLPGELLIAATNSPTKLMADSKTNSGVAAVTKKPAPMGQPLIISGKKPPVAQAPKTSDAATTNQPPLVTNASLVVAASEIPAPVSPNLATSRPLTVITQIPAPAIIPEPASPQIPSATPDQAAVQPPPRVVAEQKVGGQRTEEGGQTTAEPKSDLVAASSQQTSGTTAQTQPTSDAPREVAQPSTTNGIAAITPETPANPPPSVTASSPQSAVVPPEPILARKSILIAGLVFGVIALALIMLMMRRARAAAASSSSSLITRSLERERKP